MASRSVARHAVRKMLQSSPSYRELPPDRQRNIAHKTTRVFNRSPTRIGSVGATSLGLIECHQPWKQTTSSNRTGTMRWPDLEQPR